MREGEGIVDSIMIESLPSKLKTLSSNPAPKRSETKLKID
jgi:hypothetical protein